MRSIGLLASLAGFACNGQPGLRPHYAPDYYAAFLRDPDGNNTEALTHLAPLAWRGGVKRRSLPAEAGYL